MLEEDQEESWCSQRAGILSPSYLPGRPRLGHPHLSPTTDLVSLPTPCHRPGPSSPSHRVPLQAAAALLWVEHGREDGEGGTGRDNGAAPAKSGYGVNRTETSLESGHRKLMRKPQEASVLCTLAQPQPY